MKRLLLFITTAAFTASALAQSAPRVGPRADLKQISRMSADPIQKHNAIPVVGTKRVQPSENNTANILTLGSSANGFGNFYIGRTLLQYEPNLNTVVLTHRSNPAAGGDPNTGYYRYDLSTDGGNTWSTDLGPIYGDAYNQGNTVTGRYPVGTIANPDGNTDPNQANVVYAGPWHSGSGVPANTWHGTVWGKAQLNNTNVTEHYDSTNDVGNQTWPDDIFATRQNVIWRSSILRLDNQGDYVDTVRLVKGTWNGSDYDMTNIDLYWKSNLVITGTPDYDHNIAFADDGLTGYAVGVGNGDNDSNSVYPTGVMYMRVYMTTDGGNTWNGLNSTTPLDVSTQAPGAFTGSLVGGPWFGNFDSTFTTSGFGLNGNRPDFDMVVDASGNLHIFVAVLPGANFGETMSDPGTWGLADLYTTDKGTHWYANLVAMPNTYWGTYGDQTAQVFEGPRPHISRSNDGTKLFYSWFDTHPDFGVPTNDFPDLYVRGYDMTTNMWSNIVNVTKGTIAEGAATFGLVSYYAKESSCNYIVPAAYMTCVPDVDNPCDYYYINEVSLTCDSFIVAPPMPPILIADYTVGVNEVHVSGNFRVSANYPNPFTGATSVDITLSKQMDVTIEISNMVGQSVSTKIYSNLSAGLNRGVALDVANLAKGVYVYKVIAGQDIVTRTMTVR
jgi:hypothetical protein